MEPRAASKMTLNVIFLITVVGFFIIDIALGVG